MRINRQQMKRVLFFLMFFVLTTVDMQAQNELVKQGRQDREKPERTLIKRKNIPAKNIRTTGKWINVALPFDTSEDLTVSSDLSTPNVIEISSAEQLTYLAKQVNSGVNYFGKQFRLVADINLEGREWTPIGLSGADDDDESHRFCGAFYGNGYKIENLIITNGGDNSGLFGVCGTGAYIEKLHMTNCYVRGKMKVGGLVGELINGTVSECSVFGTVIANHECAGGMVGINNGTIVNCKSSAAVFGNSSDVGGLAGVSGERLSAVIDNCEATGLVTGYWNVGGLVGRNNSVISNSNASGDVNGDEWIGGLVGWTDEGMITCCQASGNVRGFFDIGGLVGFNGYAGSTVKISSSHANGKITGVGLGNYCVGGLAGYSGGMITDCYATGAVDAEESVGGLTGAHGGVTINSYATGNVTGSFDVGGLVGFNGYPGSKTWLENCYAKGTVTGFGINNRNIGGLAGYSGGTVVRCYSVGNTTGYDAVGVLVGEQRGVMTDCYAIGSAHVKGKRLNRKKASDK